MTFRIGQKVTPIAKEAPWINPFGRQPFFAHPEFGSVCTIQSMCVSKSWAGCSMLSFAEFEGKYDAAEFRPIVERKTDISIFTRMLDQAKVHAQ